METKFTKGPWSINPEIRYSIIFAMVAGSTGSIGLLQFLILLFIVNAISIL